MVQKLVKQFVYTNLLLIIMLCFTCGEMKICLTIKKSQNIMTMIADLDNNQDFSIMHLNIASFCKNFNEFINFLSSINYKFKIIGLFEHKISIGDNSLNWLQGYNFVYTPWTTSHGGTCFFVHSESIYKVCDDLVLIFSGEIELFIY